MARVVITPEDLEPFATIERDKAEAMIADALAMARLVAPCLAGDDLTEDQASAAKAIIRGAILRWNDVGEGYLTQRQQTAGPFSLGQSVDTRQSRKGMYWPSEIESLQAICKAIAGEAPGGAYVVDTVGDWSGPHDPICSVYFDVDYCSCGLGLTGTHPLYRSRPSA